MTNLRMICMLTVMISPYAYDNLSGNKSASQVSTFPCNGCTDGSYNAGMAVDNDPKTCTRNAEPNENPWWMIDLQETQSIYAIKFAFRQDSERERQQKRLSGYSIYVSNSPRIKSGYMCFKHNGSYLPSLTAKHVCASFGRYIQFVNERTYIELCDLVVLGCNRGHHGIDCNLPCPKHCKNDQCFVTNGTCLGCANGWTGFRCNQACSPGKYGPKCSLSCSGHCKNNSTCNPTDGICYSGCTDGWMGVFCNKSCSSGTFGPNCNRNCSVHCLKDMICNGTTGKCDEGCKPGYTGELCNDVCSNGYFGQNCSKKCSPFCFAKSCDNINGYCRNGCISGYQGSTCEQICNIGWYGQNCSRRCENCVNQSCNHITGSCFSECKPGWRGTTCSLVCSAEKYGKNCMYPCSQHCINKESCNHVTGLCKNGCESGYNGTRCNSICTNGYFGENCSHVCSENCSDICDHVDGTCNCKPGLMDSPNCKQVNSLSATRRYTKCDNQCIYAIVLSISVVLNISTCTLLILIRRRYVKLKRKSSSHYIKADSKIIEKTSESHEYQEVNAVSNDFSYQNLTFET